jgi:hypothetical protein
LLPNTVLPPHGSVSCGAGKDRCELAGTRVTVAADRSRVVTGADGPNPTSRTLILDSGGRAAGVERLENRQWIRYRLQGSAERRVAVPLDAVPAAPMQRPMIEPTPGRVVVELAAASTADDPASLAGATPRVTLTLRSSGAAARVTEISRATLQRLVLGRFVDPTPGQPLPGLAPLPQGLGAIDSVVVMQRADRTKPPWDDGREPIPGEEDATRVAAALRAWWAEDAGLKDVAVVVGTEGANSLKRLSEAPAPGSKSVLVLPKDGFFPPRTSVRDRLRVAWSAGAVTSELPDKPTDLVVLVSGEPPARLGDRLRRISRQPRMKGKLLAVYSLSGPIRVDLPASLLAEGVLAGVGLAAASTVGSDRVVDDIAAMAHAIKDGPSTAHGASDRFVWFY